MQCMRKHLRVEPEPKKPLAQVKEGIAAALQRAAEELTAEGRGALPPAEAVADCVEAAMFNLYGALPLIPKP